MNEQRTDKELALEIALRQTQMALYTTQLRACKSETQLANIGGEQANYELQALLQERKDREAAPPVATPLETPAAD